MATLVKLSKTLLLEPAELATKVIAALGMRGSGKSNAMAVIAEQLLAAGIQVVVLDDVGIWFSLRLKPDGKTPSGLDIPVMGGRHGDIPLLPTAGELVARTLAETGSPAVLDISGFRKGERARFAAAFAETVLQSKKEHPGPMLLILEESQRWIPQVIRFKGEGEERMLGAFMDIAEVGRNYGIGLGLVSQRPQKVHKECLNLTELLLAFQTNGVLERKAIAEWVQEAGAEGRDKVHNELPSLHTGEALAWSPSWLRRFERVKLAKKTTYDAGATPLAARAAVKTKPLELAQLSDAMAAVTEEAKANDPKALRAEVARLRVELQRANEYTADARRRAEAVAAEASDWSRRLLQGTLVQVRSAAFRLVEAIAATGRDAQVIAQDLKAAEAGINKAEGTGKPPARPIENPLFLRAATTSASPTPSHARARTARPSSGVDGSNWTPTGGARRILEALASSMADGMTWRQLATLAGMKPTGGGFNNYKSALRTQGCVEERGGRVFITDAGRDWVPDVGPPATGPQLVEFWKQKLPGKAGLMLELLIHEGAIPRAELAARVEMEPKGGGFNNYLSTLRANGLVTDDANGIRPAEVFYR